MHDLPGGRGGVVAEDEPRHRVEDVVQAERDEQPVDRAVDEAADDSFWPRPTRRGWSGPASKAG